MPQKCPPSRVRASEEGLKRLRDAKDSKRSDDGQRWSYKRIADKIVDISEDTVERFLTGKGVYRYYASEICKVLGLKLEDVLDLSELEASTAISEPEQTTPINWRDISRAMLDAQNELTTNPLTRNDGIEFKRDEIYVPLGLVERPKREKRSDDVSPEKGSQLYEPTEEETKILGKYELDVVCEQLLKQGNEQDQSKERPIAAIIGEPGAGKSTLQQKIADWVFHNTKADVPILVSLGAIGNKSLNQYLMEDWLRDAAQELEAAPPEWKQAFGQLLKSGRVWLLLDGADEMAADSPLEQIASQLRQGWARNVRVVLTCRLNVWDAGKNALEGFNTYRTLVFSYGDAETPDQVGQFISNWFKHSDQERGKSLRAALDQRGKERIKDLVKNPLRLALLCRTWQLWEGGLPDTKAVLYQQFVEAIYLWKDKEFSTTPDQRKLLNEKLGQLALQAIDRKDSRFRLLESFVRDLLGEPDEEGSLFWLALRLGWLNKVGVAAENPGERVYAFFHANFQEYFAALSVDDWDHFFPRAHDNQNPWPVRDTYRIFEPQWKEVFLLWMGRKDVAQKHKEELINKLIEVNNACRGFYWFRAYFLAAAGLAEFSEFSDPGIPEHIVARIVDWNLGWFGLTNFDNIYDDIQAVEHPLWLTKIQQIVQFSAFKPLLETDRHRVIAELKKLMDPSQDARLRHLAASKLGFIEPGNCEAAIKTLINLLDTSQNIYRNSEVSTSLIHLGYDNASNLSVVDAVIELLNSSNNENTHSEVAHILGYIGSGHTKAIQVLIQLVQTSKDEETLKEAVESLGKIGGGNLNVINSLIEFSLDATQQRFPRCRAISILGEIGTGNSNVINMLIDLSLDATQPVSCRCQAIEILEKFSTDNSDVINILIALLLDATQDVTCRIEAIEVLGKVGADNSDVINALREVLNRQLLNTDDDYFIRLYAAKSLSKIDTENPNALDFWINKLKDSFWGCRMRRWQMLTTSYDSHSEIDIHIQTDIIGLIDKLDNSPDEATSRKAAERLGEIGAGNSEAIAALINLLNKSLDKATRWQAANSIGKIAVGDPDAIHALSILLSNSKDEYVSQLAAESLLEIDYGNPDAINALIEALIQGKVSDHFESIAFSLKKNLQDNLCQVAVERLKNCLKDKFYKCDQRYAACYSVLWHCAANMTYPEFYKAWHSEHPTVQALENQFIDIAFQLPPTDKTYPIFINAQALEGETDKCEIAQELCNQIYLAAFPDESEIPEVSNAPQLKRLIPKIKKQLQKQNLALILDKCEPNQALIAFCCKLTDVLHIAWITNESIEAPLQGFLPNQANLLSAIQSWIDELS